MKLIRLDISSFPYYASWPSLTHSFLGFIDLSMTYQFYTNTFTNHITPELFPHLTPRSLSILLMDGFNPSLITSLSFYSLSKRWYTSFSLLVFKLGPSQFMMVLTLIPKHSLMEVPTTHFITVNSLVTTANFSPSGTD